MSAAWYNNWKCQLARQNKSLAALAPPSTRRVILTSPCFPIGSRPLSVSRFTDCIWRLVSDREKAGTNSSHPFFSHHQADVAARGGSTPRDPTDDSQEIGCFYFARFSLMQQSNFSFSLSLTLSPLSCNPPLASLDCTMNRARGRKIEMIFSRVRYSTVLVFLLFQAVIRLLSPIHISFCRRVNLFMSR